MSFPLSSGGHTTLDTFTPHPFEWFSPREPSSGPTRHRLRASCPATTGVGVRARSWGVGVLVGFLLCAVLPVQVAAAGTEGGPTAAAAAGCRPATPPPATPTTTFYDPARTYLGPQPLPESPPVGPLLVGYQRFGDLTADEFVARYRTDTGWIYPPNDGFATSSRRTPWRTDHAEVPT